MATGDGTATPAVRTHPTLAEAAEMLYRPLISHTMEEASDFDGVNVEIRLMRHWLKETIDEGKRDEVTARLMERLFTQIIRAVAVKYRLSPQGAAHLAAATEVMLRYVHEEVLAPVTEEDL